MAKQDYKIKLTDQQIIEIAGELDAGMIPFYHLESGELVVVPDLERFPYVNEEGLWQEDLEEIEENRDDYFEFTAMDSREAFSVMADFAETVEDQKIQDKLMDALNGPKPFRNFKWQIDNSGEYRKKWFDYKTERYIEFVKAQVDFYNSDDDEEG